MAIKNYIIPGLVILAILITASNLLFSNRLRNSIEQMKGKLEILEEVRANMHSQQLLFSQQLTQTDVQIRVLQKMDSSLSVGFQQYSDNFKSIKRKYNETVTAINLYGSDDLKQYFAALTEPQ